MSEAFERELNSRLQALAACSPPSDGWEQFQQRRRRRLHRPLLAAAATVRSDDLQASDQASTSPNPLPTLIAQSQALEHQWRQRKVALTGGNEAQRIARLEGGLAMIDVQLNAAAPGSPEELALWRNRVQLMSALVATPQTDPGLRTAAYEVPL